MRILLVEDDELITQPLAKALTDQHYVVDVAPDGQAGWELLDSFTYDLILLDVMLPKLDGISLCRRLRRIGNQTPILLLTAQDTSTNKVMGLDAGADDYLAKPFNLQELSARIRALLRRGSSALPPILKWKNLRLDPSTCEVTCGSQPVHLTPKEYGLLELFLRNSHRIFSCGAILDQLWSFEEPPGEDTVRSHLKGLRHKLRAAGVVGDPIETIYGIGYRLKSEEQGAGSREQGAGSREQGAGSREQGAEEQRSRGAEEQEMSSSPLPPIPSAPLPHHPITPSPHHPITPSDSQEQLSAGISNVWQQVNESLSQRVAAIEQAMTMLLQDSLSSELRSKALQEAHKLAGSLGMFGSDEGSRLAQEIELLFASGVKLDRNQRLHLSQLVVALRQELQLLNAQQSPELLSVDERPRLLIVDQDRSLAEELAKEAASWGMRSQIAKDPTTAQELISDKRPDAMLLDLSHARTAENGLTLLSEMSACTPPVPVIVITAQDSLLDRVKVARLGGRWVLQKPVTPAQVLEAVNQVLQNARTTEARVMVVDDDPQVLTALQTLLVPWGLKVSTLDNPLHFLDALNATSPELLVLDVEMPQISGIELCQVVRNHPRWSGLPILFLTAHTDAQTMHQVFAAGADDYVSKPIVGPELVTRILNRLERSHLLRSLAEIDVLTGVANRRKSTADLSRFLQLSDRHHQPFCLAILDLDHLKQINHLYGHAAGDQVLSRLGELLRRTFHTEDVVGRWGGTEFVVGMAGMTKSDGVLRLSEVLKSLHKLEFTAANSTQFRATFSAGVVQYPQDGADLQTLYQAADAALDRAKAAGRNRVLSAE